jgi:hypothetical protein
MNRYHPYSNPETLVSSNILLANTATFQATSPNYNNLLNNQKNVKLINQANDILKYQNEIFVDDSFTNHQIIKELPREINGGNGEYRVKFEIKTLGFVKANNIRLLFKIPVRYYYPINALTEQISANTELDTLSISNLEQPPFTFLDVIDRLDITIGDKKTSMFPNENQKESKRLFTLKNCMKPKQSIFSLTTGLNCQRTTRQNWWSSENYDLYNQIFNFNNIYDIANVTSSANLKSDFEYTVNLALADILPFFEINTILPLGFVFTLEITFKAKQDHIFMGGVLRTDMQNYSRLVLNTDGTQWPIIPSKIFIEYDSYSIKNNLIDKYNKLPSILVNNTYLVEKIFNPSLNVSSSNFTNYGNGKYLIHFANIIPPEKIIMFFSIYESAGRAMVMPTTNLNSNDFNKNILNFDSKGFFGGFQLKNIKTYVSNVLKFSTVDDDSNLLQTSTYLDGKDSKKYNYWNYSMNFDEMYLNDCKEEKNDILTRLKLIDNIIPIEIPCNNSGMIKKNTIENLGEATSLKIEFEIQGDYSVSTDSEFKTYNSYFNILPDNCNVHLIFEYNYQLLYDRQNQEISTISYPFLLLDNKITLNSQ